MSREERLLRMHDACARNPRAFARLFFPQLCYRNFSPLHDHLFAHRAAQLLPHSPSSSIANPQSAIGNSQLALPNSAFAIPNSPFSTLASQFSPSRPRSLDVVLAPRCSAKSTLLSLLFPLHALLYGNERYVLLVAATQRQARQRVADLRGLLESACRAPEFRHVFRSPLADIRQATVNALEIGDVRVEAVSAGGELRGVRHGAWRPTWVILDDAERDDRVARADYRDRMFEWFNQVIEPLGDGYTRVSVVGTLLHPDALPARLATRPDARASTWASIIHEADRHDLWDEWRAILLDRARPDRERAARAFFEARREAMEAGSRVLWPDQEDYYDLNLRREQIGVAAFNKEKQNAPHLAAPDLFAPTRLSYFTLPTPSPSCSLPSSHPPPPASQPSPNSPPTLHASESSPNSPFSILTSQFSPNSESSPNSLFAIHNSAFSMPPLRHFGYLDPALGNPDGDFAAIVTLGVGDDGIAWVLDDWLERAPPSRQIARIFELHERWNYESFGIETNAFQQLLMQPLEDERRRRLELGLPSALPIDPAPRHGDKAARIAALEPLVQGGFLRFNRALSAEFFRQFTQFPRAPHDDAPDALAGALALARSHPRLHLHRPRARPRSNF